MNTHAQWSRQFGSVGDCRIAAEGRGPHDGFLELAYSLSPVPPTLADDQGVHTCQGDAVAVGEDHAVYLDSLTSYRIAGNGRCVTGIVRLGPSSWPSADRLRILFAPLAGALGLESELCEVCVVLGPGGVSQTAVRHR